MRIIIPDFPFPPTSNHTRGSFFHKNSGKMIHYDKTGAKKFKKAVADWAWPHHRMLKQARGILLEKLKDQKHQVVVDAYFGFNHSDLWSATGIVKGTDVSNRIKSLHDAISGLIGIDDCYFTVGKAQRCFLSGAAERFVFVVLSVERTPAMTEVLDLIQSKGV